MPGFAGPLRINLITLQQDGGFGKVDGLSGGSSENTLFVTTVGLYKAWLAEIPQRGEFPSALRKDDFYYASIGTDAAFWRYADLDIRPPHGATTAGAALMMEGQDFGPWPPDCVVAFVVKGNRVLMAKVDVKAPEIPGCADPANRLRDAAAQTTFDAKADEQAYQAYRDCYAKAAPSLPFYGPLVRKTQDLLDRLSAGADR